MKNKRRVRLSLLIKIGVLIVLLFLAESIAFRFFLKDTFTDVNLTYQTGVAENIIITAEDSVALNEFQEWQFVFWMNHKQAIIDYLKKNDPKEVAFNSMMYLFIDNKATGNKWDLDGTGENWILDDTLVNMNPEDRIGLAAYSLMILIDKMTIAGNRNCEVFFAEVNPGEGYTIFARNERDDGRSYDVLGTKVDYPISETQTGEMVSITDEAETGTSLFCYRLYPKNKSGKQYMIGYRSDWTQLQEGIVEASNRSFYTILMMTGVVVVLLLILLYLLMARRTSRIRKAVLSYEETKDASDVAEHLSGLRKSSDEIGVLAGAFSDLTVEVDRYMQEQMELAAEKEKLGAELSIATMIQSSSLPTNFSDFTGRGEFDLFASMDPAKAVGGDFYDMYYIDENHLAVTVADVSDKGVPAALFMMISKTLIKVRAMRGGTPAEILMDANEWLAENNKARMFVTVFLAILTISDGSILVANAGHEYPTVCPAGAEFMLVREKHGAILGARRGMKYENIEYKANPGDTFFLYTDGVPEATNADGEQFGEERMLESLNRHKEDNPEELLRHVREDIDAFVGDAPQFDDLTMMSIRYRGIE